MFRRVIALLFLALFLMSTMACTTFMNTTQKYLLALDNTNNAHSVESKTEFKISLDLTKASQKLKSELEKFKDITVNVDKTVEKKNEREKLEVFIDSGEFTFSTVVYLCDKKVYLKSSYLGDKYLDVSSYGRPDGNKDVSGNKDEDLNKELIRIWVDAIENEVLTKEGSSTLYTPDGDIKITQLSLELKDDKAKNIFIKLAEVLSKSEEVKEIGIEGGLENASKLADKKISDENIIKGVEDFLKKLPDRVRKLNEKFIFDRLKISAKIDMDNYIVDNTLEGESTVKYEGEWKINCKIHTTSWNINGSVKVDMPEFTDENTTVMNGTDSSDWNSLKEYLNIN